MAGRGRRRRRSQTREGARPWRSAEATPTRTQAGAGLGRAGAGGGAAPARPASPVVHCRCGRHQHARASPMACAVDALGGGAVGQSGSRAPQEVRSPTAARAGRGGAGQTGADLRGQPEGPDKWARPPPLFGCLHLAPARACVLPPLLQSGADPLQQDGQGMTPLACAAASAEVEEDAAVVRLLRDAVALVPDNEQRLPLHWAAFRAPLAVVRAWSRRRPRRRCSPTTRAGS